MATGDTGGAMRPRGDVDVQRNPPPTRMNAGGIGHQAMSITARLDDGGELQVTVRGVAGYGDRTVTADVPLRAGSDTEPLRAAMAALLEAHRVRAQRRSVQAAAEAYAVAVRRGEVADDDEEDEG